MKFTEWGSKRQKSWYRQMRRKERKEYQDANNIGWDFNALFPTAWWSFQPDHLYADVDKTVPATLGGGIASFDDLSGNAVTGPQSVSTARPIMGRVPRTGRRNIATRSEMVNETNRGWASGNYIDSLDVHGKQYLRFTAPGSGVVMTGFSAAPVEDGEYVISWFWLPNDPTEQIGIIRSAAPLVNPVNGSIRGDGTKELTNGDDIVDVEVLSTGELRISIQTLVVGGSGGRNYRWNIYATDGDPRLLTGEMFELGDSVTPYQRVTNEYDVTEAGVPSVHYAHYDIADDVLPHNATLPAITDGTVILVGQQGIWIDEGYSFAGGNWSFGPTTYPSGPEGVIGVVGDMLDLVVLDRPLTADERDRVVAYGIERGSAGLLELLP